MSRPTRREQADLVRRIHAHGYQVVFVDYCEDASTPGLLGQIRGVTDHQKREVKIGRRANPTLRAMNDILAHELHHVEDPTWDCGSRAPWRLPEKMQP